MAAIEDNIGGGDYLIPNGQFVFSHKIFNKTDDTSSRNFTQNEEQNFSKPSTSYISQTLSVSPDAFPVSVDYTCFQIKNSILTRNCCKKFYQAPSEKTLSHLSCATVQLLREINEHHKGCINTPIEQKKKRCPNRQISGNFDECFESSSAEDSNAIDYSSSWSTDEETEEINDCGPLCKKTSYDIISSDSKVTKFAEKEEIPVSLVGPCAAATTSNGALNMGINYTDDNINNNKMDDNNDINNNIVITNNNLRVIELSDFAIESDSTATESEMRSTQSVKRKSVKTKRITKRQKKSS